MLVYGFNTTLYDINSIKTTNSSVSKKKFVSPDLQVPKSEMVVSTLCQHWYFASINSITTTNSSVSKSGMIVPTLKQPCTSVASINSIKTINFSVSKSGICVPTLKQPYTNSVSINNIKTINSSVSKSGMVVKVKVQVYSLISSLKTYHPTLHFTPWSLDLFIREPFQFHWEHTVLQAFRRIELIAHIAISVLPGTHFHLSQVKHWGWSAFPKDTTS